MENANQHFIWALSAHVLFLYVAAVAVFFSVLSGNLRAMEAITDKFSARTPLAAGKVLLLTFGSNFIAAALVALLASLSAIDSRHSMVLIPFILLSERHARLAWKEKRAAQAHGSAFLGGAAGMLSGAWLFLRSDFTQDTFKRVVVPGDVATLPLSQVLDNQSDWAISIQLVVFYCVALAIFFGVHELLKRFVRPKQGVMATATLAALALNFLGVAVLVLLGGAAGVKIRMAMVIFPLFLILESHVKQLRANPSDRRACFADMIGSAAGIASAAYLMLRGAPIQ